MSTTKEKIAKQNRWSFILGIPGLILQGVGSNSLLILLGTVLLVAGFGMYARMKGRHVAWGLLGVVSIVGLIVLYFLPKQCHQCEESQSYSNDTCESCGAALSP